MVLLFCLPLMAAVMGIIIGLLCFIGVCLLIIGITGAAMNRIYMKQMKTKNSVSKPLFNISSIILGFIFLLFPLGYVLYEIISSLSK